MRQINRQDLIIILAIVIISLSIVLEFGLRISFESRISANQTLAEMCAIQKTNVPPDCDPDWFKIYNIGINGGALNSLLATIGFGLILVGWGILSFDIQHIMRYLKRYRIVAPLTVVLLFFSFVALWISIRLSGLIVSRQLFENRFVIGGSVQDATGIVAFVLLAYLGYSLTQTFISSEDKDMPSASKRLISSSILAITIGIIAMLPVFSEASFYNTWSTQNQYAPQSIIIVLSLSVLLLALAYTKLSSSQKT